MNDSPDENPLDDASGPPVCPNCGRILSATPVTVIRPEDAALERLFQGRLNVVRCPDCDSTVALGTPVLFRDDEERFLIYYLPLKDPARWREAEENVRAITRSIFGSEDAEDVPEIRLVVTRRAFIEKIALHLRGLDDRIVEYLKYRLYTREDERIDPRRLEVLYDFSASDDERLAFILFDRESGEARAAAHFPMEVYRDLEELFASDTDAATDLDRIFPGAYVSVDRLLADLFDEDQDED